MLPIYKVTPPLPSGKAVAICIATAPGFERPTS
jgi:hypothetical protein